VCVRVCVSKFVELPLEVRVVSSLVSYFSLYEMQHRFVFVLLHYPFLLAPVMIFFHFD